MRKIEGLTVKGRIEYYNQYHKDYYKLKKRGNSTVKDHAYIEIVYAPIYIKFKPINEETLKIKQQRCQWHRCNKLLTMTERLYGNNCLRHSIGQTPNVDNLNKLFI